MVSRAEKKQILAAVLSAVETLVGELDAEILYQEIDLAAEPVEELYVRESVADVLGTLNSVLGGEDTDSDGESET